MTSARQVFDIPLVPVAGARFQPTGFPDIGAALFKRPRRDGDKVHFVDALLVESAQSMANRLEGVGWDTGRQQPVDALAGLPYVRVVADDGRYLTSSRTEAHRLASAFVKDSSLNGTKMTDVIRERLGLRDDTPIASRDIAAAVFALDPLCLLHGVFFAESAKVWPGQPRIPRAVTGFIEAVDVHPAHSGGVKKDLVRHSLDDNSGGTREGYGTIPFHRTEWAAAQITASFVIDLAQLASYGLPAPATELLTTLARWEIRTLLDRGLRLRTACDLAVEDGVTVQDRTGTALPGADELAEKLADRIAGCSDLLGPGAAIEVRWDGGQSKRGRRAGTGAKGS
ncbi:MAG: type I-U CRISPR-associated protein Cas7 [Frankia sp.]|nr:type I-U CRISPR-associated protein Cas7 [Frankia sp.]